MGRSCAAPRAEVGEVGHIQYRVVGDTLDKVVEDTHRREGVEVDRILRMVAGGTPDKVVEDTENTG